MDGQSDQVHLLFQCRPPPFIFSFMHEGRGHLGVVNSYRNSSELFARAVLLSSDWRLAEVLPLRQVL